MGKAQFGLVGLAVMGQNLVRNVERNGFSCAVFNRTTSKMEDFIKEFGEGHNFTGCKTLEEFADALETPRKIMFLVKAGPAVDATIASLKPHLQKGDLLIDGGNSFFKDTDRRTEELEKDGILYIGAGVSGGEFGALNGPSIMPGGQKEAWNIIKPIFEAISAKVNGEPCVAYMGRRSAGHYVKTVHNGIEYGDMQLISEIYDILHRGAGVTHPELNKIFEEWNNAELDSFLINITKDIFLKKDEETGNDLVDMVLDEAKAKGTGKWTSQNAMDLGIPIPTVNAAVSTRMLSALKEQRVAASKVLTGPDANFSGDKQKLIDDCRGALYAAKICSYAQGMSLLREASNEYDFGCNMGEIAKIWRGGCIIQAKLLELIRAAFAKNADLPNLLMDEAFKDAIVSRQQSLRNVVKTAIDLGIPTPGLADSLIYYDAFRTARLPANLVQAQRDYFGAHTYQRTDKEGIFHSDWRAS